MLASASLVSSVLPGRAVVPALPARRGFRLEATPSCRWQRQAAVATTSAGQPQAGSQQTQAAQNSSAATLPSLAERVCSPGVVRGAAVVGALGLLAAVLPGAADAAAKAAANAAAADTGGLTELAKKALSFVLHLDVHLGEIVAKYGTATYAILFAIVFAETGLVVTPFLPGDSLLFATGALAALGKLNVWALVGCYVVAATLGDAVNYAVGNYLGTAAFKSRLLKREHIVKTEEFYNKYGGKTVVLARFVPIVRTFAPFVAGVGSMSYPQFAAYNVAGALLWTAVCVGAGFAFGNVPAVHENFSLVVLGIIAVSLLPIAWEMYAARGEGATTAAAAAPAATGNSAEAAGAASEGAVPHSTPPAAVAAVETAGLPPRMFPAAAAAAAEAVEVAKAKAKESAIADPLEDARVQDCETNPSQPECRVYDD